MQLNITTPSGTSQFNVQVSTRLSISQYKKIEYVELLSKKTVTYDYGSTYDKFVTEISIIGENSDIQTISELLNSDIDQIFILCQDYERIFGAGIDYTNLIYCNITNRSRPVPQNNIRLSAISMTIEAVNSNGSNLIFKSSIPTGLPSKLNFQLPIRRTINKKSSAFSTEKFGDYGHIVEVDSLGAPLNNYIIDINFDQKQKEAEQIEKFANTQRATPFIFSEADFIYLFPNQATKEVIIKDFSTKRVALNRWNLSMRLISNV